MRDYYILFIYMSFIIFGLSAPFVAMIGYMWADIYSPQSTSTFVAAIPSSLILAVVAVGAYIMLDRRSPARFTLHTGLTLLLAFWVTLTLTWAEAPIPAWTKWDWAVKTVVFSAFIPLVIRSRVQIEAFLQVFLFAMAFQFMPPGVKTMISGSSYGRDLGVLGGNTGLAESSTLATACIALIPLILYLRRHSILLPKSRWRDVGYLGLILIAVICAIGTYARTAIIGFAVVGIFMWFQSKRKGWFTVVAAIGIIGVGAMASSSWQERIASSADFQQESSALGRILVWRWTIGYVMEHPAGGGFDAFRINRIEFPPSTAGGAPVVSFGKAYHNSYFEMLGEHGFPGLLIWLSILTISMKAVWTVSKRTRGDPEMAWIRDLSQALLTSLVTTMACSFFIGIAFQAFYWYFIALPICVREYLVRVDLPAETRTRRGGLPGYATAGPAPRPR